MTGLMGTEVAYSGWSLLLLLAMAASCGYLLGSGWTVHRLHRELTAVRARELMAELREQEEYIAESRLALQQQFAAQGVQEETDYWDSDTWAALIDFDEAVSVSDEQ